MINNFSKVNGILLSFLMVNIGFAADATNAANDPDKTFKLINGKLLKDKLPVVDAFLESMKTYLVIPPDGEISTTAESSSFHSICSKGCSLLGSGLRTLGDFGRNNPEEAKDIAARFCSSQADSEKSPISVLLSNHWKSIGNGMRFLGAIAKGGETPMLHRGFKKFIIDPMNNLKTKEKILRFIAHGLLFGKHFKVTIQFPAFTNDEMLSQYLQVIENLEMGAAISFKGLTKEEQGEQFINAFVEYLYYTKPLEISTENAAISSSDHASSPASAATSNVSSSTVSQIQDNKTSLTTTSSDTVSTTTTSTLSSSRSSDAAISSEGDEVVGEEVKPAKKVTAAKEKAEKLVKLLELYINKFYELHYILSFNKSYSKTAWDNLSTDNKHAALRDSFLNALVSQVRLLDDLNGQNAE